MRILCPQCSKTEPLAIDVAPEDEATICPKCSRRYRLRTRQILNVQAHRGDRGYSYRLQTAEGNGGQGIQRISSQLPLQITGQRTVTIVRRGGSVVGVADQDAQTWVAVQPLAPRFPTIRRLLVALAWPITILAGLQMIRFWAQSAELLRTDPLAAATLLVAVGVLALAPVIWWLIRVIFPDGPKRRQLIPGWNGSLDED